MFSLSSSKILIILLKLWKAKCQGSVQFRNMLVFYLKYKPVTKMNHKNDLVDVHNNHKMSGIDQNLTTKCNSQWDLSAVGMTSKKHHGYGKQSERVKLNSVYHHTKCTSLFNSTWGNSSFKVLCHSQPDGPSTIDYRNHFWWESVKMSPLATEGQNMHAHRSVSWHMHLKFSNKFIS